MWCKGESHEGVLETFFFLETSGTDLITFPVCIASSILYKTKINTKQKTKQKIWAQPQHIPRMYRELDLILPAHIAARLDQLAVQPAPRLRAQLMRPPREEPKGWGGTGVRVGSRGREWGRGRGLGGIGGGGYGGVGVGGRG